MVISDEKHFPLFSAPNRKNDIVWDVPEARNTYIRKQHPPQVKVWGAICISGVINLVEYTGNLSAK